MGLCAFVREKPYYYKVGLLESTKVQDPTGSYFSKHDPKVLIDKNAVASGSTAGTAVLEEMAQAPPPRARRRDCMLHQASTSLPSAARAFAVYRVPESAGHEVWANRRRRHKVAVHATLRLEPRISDDGVVVERAGLWLARASCTFPSPSLRSESG